MGNKSGNILLVEDNEGIMFNLKLTLELSNFNVLTAQNGKEAIKILEESSENPNLILSDIMMPEMGGFDFFAYVSTKDEWNKIPFIFLSAKTSPREIRFGKILGADDYLIKPVNQKELINAINNKMTHAYLLKPKIEEKIVKIFKNSNITSQNFPDHPLIYFITESNEMEPELNSMLSDLPQSQKMIWEDIGIQIYKSFIEINDELNSISSASIFVPLKNESDSGILFVFDLNPSTNKKSMVFIISNLLNYFNSLKLKYHISNFIINNLIQMDFEFESLGKEIEKILNE